MGSAASTTGRAAPSRLFRLSADVYKRQDLDYLEPGHSYKDLPTAYVIFICTLDCLGQGLPLYTIRSQIQETGLLFGDESVTLILNTKCAPELVPEPLKELYAYINDPQNKFSDPLIEKIDARVKKFNSAEWRRRQMTFGEMLDRSKQKGIEQGIAAFIAADVYKRQAILGCHDRIWAAVWQLYGERITSVEEGVLRRIAGRHVVKWNPALVSIGINSQIVAHRHLEAVDLFIVGDRSRAVVLTLFQGSIHEPIVLRIRLMSR